MQLITIHGHSILVREDLFGMTVDETCETQYCWSNKTPANTTAGAFIQQFMDKDLFPLQWYLVRVGQPDKYIDQHSDILLQDGDIVKFG